MTADEVRAALRRSYGLTAGDLRTEEWTLHDEVPLGRYGGPTIDVLAVRAWGGRPAGHERHAIEIKISRGDFRRELAAEKWQPWASVVHRLFFAAPAGLLGVDEIPDGCGLLVVGESGVRAVVPAPRRSPEPLPETVWVELARRASRLAERLRRAELGGDPTATAAQQQIDVQRLDSRVLSLHHSIRAYRERIATLLAVVRADGVACEDCRATVTFTRGPGGRWRYEHAEPSTRCTYARPIMADLLEPPEELVLGDGCVGGHSPDLVSCELGAEWP